MSNTTLSIGAMERLGTALAQVGTVVGTYRKGLVAGGMSEEVADRLAVDLNNRLMDQSFAKAKMPPAEARQTTSEALVESFQRKNGA